MNQQGHAQANQQPQGQPQPPQVNLEINPNDPPEVKYLKGIARAQQMERQKDIDRLKQNEYDLKNIQMAFAKMQEDKERAEKEAERQEYQRMREQETIIQLEKELERLEHEKLIRRMAGVHIQPPPIPRQVIQPPKLVLKNPQQMHLEQKQETVQQNDEKVEEMQIIIQLLSKVAGQDVGSRQLIETLQNKVMTQREKQTQVSQQINQATTIAKKFKPALPYPTNIINQRQIGIQKPRIMDPSKISLTIKPFNPTHKPKPDFADTWNYILNYTEGEQLLEDEYKIILNYSLEGEAHRFFNSLKQMDKSLQEILDAFTQLYTRRRTLDDDIADFNSFKRNEKEPIYEAIQRAKILAERLESLHSPAAWPEIKTNMLKCVLTQIISKNCKKYLATEERKHKRVGAEISFDTLIDLVEDYETAHDDIPNKDIETIFNACSFSVKSDADVILARMNSTPAFRSSSKIRTKSIDAKLDKLYDQVSHLNAIIHKERQKPRSPSPHRSQANTRYPVDRSRRPLRDNDTEMKDVSSQQQRSQTPTAKVYEEHKGSYNPQQQFATNNKKVHYSDSKPQPKNDANSDRKRSNNNTQQYNRSYSRDRYNNQYSRDRSSSRDARQTSRNPSRDSYYRDSNNRSRQYRSNESRSRDRRSYSRDSQRSNSQSRSYPNQKYDANRSNQRHRSRDSDGHEVKVLINSNEGICTLCKQQIRANTFCAATGILHDQSN